MKRQLIPTLLLGLLACGGSQSPDDTAPVATTGAAEPAAETTAEATAPETEEASSDEKRRKDPSDAGEFQINDADKSSRPTQAKLKATDTEAAVRFFVVDKDKGPIEGIVISLTSPTGKTYYTGETDAQGFAEVLVPIGQTYDLVYLSLGRSDVAAKVKVANEPRLNLKLTMRYKKEVLPTGGKSDKASDETPRFVLENVHFPSGKATLTPDSHARLDVVVEYLLHKPSARIEISGHTDNVGSKKENKKLSQKRADAVRDYIVSQGVDPGRIETIGYGDEKPVAPNDTPEGQAKNRRIEAREL